MALQEQTATELRRLIIQGELAPGTRLSEVDLARRFNTSRSPIREAVVLLEREGFLKRTATGRVHIRDLDVEEARQLFVIRAPMEGLAARLAAENISLKDIERLEASLVAMQLSIGTRDFGEAMRAGSAFHDVITENCRNELLMEYLASLRARNDRYRHILASIEEFGIERIAEHRKIADALRARDPDAAEAAMSDHIKTSSETTLRAIRAYLARRST